MWLHSLYLLDYFNKWHSHPPREHTPTQTHLSQSSSVDPNSDVAISSFPFLFFGFAFHAFWSFLFDTTPNSSVRCHIAPTHIFGCIYNHRLCLVSIPILAWEGWQPTWSVKSHVLGWHSGDGSCQLPRDSLEIAAKPRATLATKKMWTKDSGASKSSSHPESARKDSQP